MKEIDPYVGSKHADRGKCMGDTQSAKYILSLFRQWSGSINRYSLYRKTLYRMVVVGKYDDLLASLKSKTRIDAEMNAFYEAFDSMFLYLYPDFVYQISAMMANPSKPRRRRLSTEMRIIALMKLGIEDTDEISAMLCYSPRTIYNLRTLIRSKLTVSVDEFYRRLASIPSAM